MESDPSQEWLALNSHLALLHKPSRLQMAQPPPPVPSTPSSSDIQAHLYNAFLTRSLPDVALNVQGRAWHAVYHAHKVVLIQAVCPSLTLIYISHLTRAGLLPRTIHRRFRGELTWRRRGRRRAIRHKHYPSWCATFAVRYLQRLTSYRYRLRSL